MSDISVAITESIISASVAESTISVTATPGAGITVSTSTDPVSVAVTGQTVTASITSPATVSVAVTETPVSVTVTAGLGDAPANGSTYGRNNNAWAAIAAGVTDHAALSNLSYAAAGHTGFSPDTHNHSGVYQPLDADLIAIAALGFTSAAFLKKTAADTWALDTATYQLLDAALTSIAALGTAADKTLYTTGVDTWAETGLTAFGRSLIDDADAVTGRATLGLGAAALLAVPITAANGGTGIANGASASLTLPNLAISFAGAVDAGAYTLPNTSQTLAGLAVSGQTFTTAQKINANSTTALLVEQTGVNSNVLVVDTTNSRTFLTGSDTSTNSIVYPLFLDHSTTATPAIGIGTGIKFRTEASDGNQAELGAIKYASEVGGVPFNAMYSGVTFTIWSNGVEYSALYINKLRIATFYGQGVFSTNSTSIGTSGALGLWNGSWVVGNGSELQFGVSSEYKNHQVIRGQLTSSSGNGTMDLIFGSRISTSATVPSETLRLVSN